MFRPCPLRITVLMMLISTLVACGIGAAPPQTVQAPVATPSSPTATIAHPPATATVTSTLQAPTPRVETPTASPAPATMIATPSPTIPATETLQAAQTRRLTGRILPRGQVSTRPWMVMIDNHPDAYPQSGLDKAAIIFEGLAEFGITRFIATYADGITPDATQIGPIRSTRAYFAQWAMGFHPVYVHAGGSPDGEQLVRTTHELVNMDADGSPYSYRDRSRVAPHNLYTTSLLLRKYDRDNGIATLSNDDVGYLYSGTVPSGTPISTITYFFADRSSTAGWQWSPTDGVYYRTELGRPHVDRLTGARVWTNNLIVMQVSGAQRPGDPKERIDQNVVGSGDARFFRNGQMVAAKWVKSAQAAPLRFYDMAGAEIRFAEGSMWLAAIPGFDRLTTR